MTRDGVWEWWSGGVLECWGAINYGERPPFCSIPTLQHSNTPARSDGESGQTHPC